MYTKINDNTKQFTIIPGKTIDEFINLLQKEIPQLENTINKIEKLPRDYNSDDDYDEENEP